MRVTGCAVRSNKGARSEVRRLVSIIQEFSARFVLVLGTIVCDELELRIEREDEDDYDSGRQDRISRVGHRADL